MSISRTNVVSVIPTLAKSGGGPSYSVSALCEASAGPELAQTLVTVYASSAEPEVIPSPDLVKTVRVAGIHSPTLRVVWSPTFSWVLTQTCRNSAAFVLHNHGLWSQPNHTAARVALALGLPMVVSTHGMLSAWALHHKAWKKRIAWALYQRRDLMQALAFRATAQDEASAIRKLGFQQPIAIIPNGIHIPAWTEPTTRTAPRTVLFVGRIYPVKGLVNLVRAWGLLRPAGWRCVIAGPDEAGHLAELRALMGSAGVSGDFSFPGAVDGDAKWQIYKSADILVLPSFTENFGIVVAEALASGVPVVTTKGTPWECLVTEGCGWWVDIGPEPLAKALREAMAATDEQRLAMGKRGRSLVEQRFSWPEIGGRMRAVYEWLLHAGPCPSCIVFD